MSVVRFAMELEGTTGVQDLELAFLDEDVEAADVFVGS
jgi:hypothetical protein